MRIYLDTCCLNLPFDDQEPDPGDRGLSTNTRAERTLEQVRETGISALAGALGPSDMIRFLQSLSNGSGAYTGERRRTLKDGSVRELVEEILSRRHNSSGAAPTRTAT